VVSIKNGMGKIRTGSGKRLLKFWLDTCG